MARFSRDEEKTFLEQSAHAHVYFEESIRKSNELMQKRAEKERELWIKEHEFFQTEKEFAALLAQAAEYKRKLASLLPRKNILPEELDVSLTEIVTALQFHKNVLYQFLSAHLSPGAHFDKVTHSLNRIFNSKIKPGQKEDAENIYSNLLSEIKLPEQARKQFLGYLQVLYQCNVFAFKRGTMPVILSAVEASLTVVFKQHCKKDDKQSIQKYYLREQTYQSDSNTRTLSTPVLLDQLSEVHSNEVSEVNTIVNQLYQQPAVKRNDAGIKTYVAQIEDTASKMVQAKTAHLELKAEIQALREQQEAEKDLNDVLKYQILAAYRHYELAMRNKSITEKAVHTNQGMNAAKQLLTDITYTGFKETLVKMLEFMNKTQTLRDNSFLTRLLKVLHAPAYGFMSLGRVAAKPHINAQLHQYRQQIDLPTALCGHLSSVRLVEPPVPLRKYSKAHKALNTNLTWGGLFSKSNGERRSVRDATVKKLSEVAGPVTCSVVPAAAAVLAGHPSLVPIAVTGGYGFWRFVKESVAKVMQGPAAPGNSR